MLLRRRRSACGASPGILLFALATVVSSAEAQARVVASVPSSEAATSGVLAVSGGKDLLGGASVVTALERPAHVTLFRGGELLVCQSSVTHLTAGSKIHRLVGKDDPLLVSLDRGALELRTSLSGDDALITPDLRFTSADSRSKGAPLDLALRVTPNGDTCVENRGRKAPLLHITDAFGQATYLLKPGQHVLFEHGSLNEVVDRETTPCGCPTPAEGISLADAAVRGGSGKKQEQIAKAYPFPAEVSEGLAPARPLPAEAPGETRIQVAGTLSADPADESAASPPSTTTNPAAAAAPPPQPSPETASQPAPKQGVFHSIGRFFQKIFAR